MRVLVLSDIHANLAALESVLSDAERVEFLGETGFEQIWCLGDVVGYGADPNECVARLRAYGDDHLCVAGNHDWAALGRLEVDDFNAEARKAVLWTRKELSQESLAYLRGLPSEPVVRGDYTITHASPRHPVWEYVITPYVAAENLPYFATSCCLLGHTHVPMIFQCKEANPDEGTSEGCRALSPSVHQPVCLVDGHRRIINPGSVGQPRDSDPRAAYALLDTEAHVLRSRRVAYAYELTQARMRAASLPDRLIARLAYGW